MCAVYDRKSQDADHATHKYLSVKHEGDWYYDYIIYKNLNLSMKMQILLILHYLKKKRDGFLRR